MIHVTFVAFYVKVRFNSKLIIGGGYLAFMSEQGAFSNNSSKIKEIIHNNVEAVLKSKKYEATQVKSWCEEIIRNILKELSADQFMPFKYLANCLVLSKRSNGVHTVTMSLWDPQNDGSISDQWDDNETMQCITTVWGLKY